jgi:Ricin-type beta-trefoil lectin domain
LQAKTNETSNTKKQLKKKLSLNYTADRFETDLNQDQKTAILKSLKKWKGELPIDNKFTVTSIADLKSETNDDNKVFKKKNKNIPNAKVVYMWSQTTNPSYDPKNPIESEEGDPRFIRTMFNVLLKQNKNGDWKASIERDPEARTESQELLETDEDIQIYKDLFATDIADNGFTATEELLIEDENSNSSVSVSSFTSSQVSTSLSLANSSSQISSSSQASSTTSSQSNASSNKSSWLQNILGLGTVKASASPSEFSWPWTSGQTWNITQGWHECETVNSSNAGSTFVGEIKGCALDIAPPSGVSNILKAPITSTITRSCKDNDQGTYNFGNKMSVTHLKASSMSSDTGAFIRKASDIGTVFDPGFENHTFDPRWQQINNTGPYGFNTNCGWTSGTHIHVKFAAITDPLLTNPNVNYTTNPFDSRTLAGYVQVDGFTLQGPKITSTQTKQNYNPIPNSTFYSLTSLNTPNTNNFTGKIKSYTNNNLVFDIKDFNGGANAPVQLYTYSTNNTENQQWGYDAITKQIKGMNNRCLGTGNTTNPSDRLLKMVDCTSSTTQKWLRGISDRLYPVSDLNLCISLYPNTLSIGSIIGVNDCNTTNGLKLDVSTLGIPVTTNPSEISASLLNLKVNLSGPYNSTTKLMNQDLKTNNKIPLSQPYNVAPWNYTGTESIPNSASINANAVDWVLVEVKNTTGTTVLRKAGLLLKDGTVVDANTGSLLTMTGIVPNNYYKIIVRHRNHLAIATDQNIYLGEYSAANVDLTKNVNVKAANQSNLGTNTTGQTVYGMRLGNVNGDDKINVLDVSASLNAPDSTSYSIYDANLNSITNVVDTGLVRNAPDAFEAI